MRSKTFPKENLKKVNDTVKTLRAKLRKLQKEVDFLRNEIENIVKPVRDRKKSVKLEVGSAEWRLDFVQRFKKDVLGEK